MSLLDFMPRKSCSKDVVLIGTYSFTRYAKKEMEQSFVFGNLLTCYIYLSVCFVPRFNLIHWPLSVNIMLLDTIRDRHCLTPFR